VTTKTLAQADPELPDGCGTHCGCQVDCVPLTIFLGKLRVHKAKQADLAPDWIKDGKADPYDQCTGNYVSCFCPECTDKWRDQLVGVVLPEQDFDL